MLPRPPVSTLFPYTTLFRSRCEPRRIGKKESIVLEEADEHAREQPHNRGLRQRVLPPRLVRLRSEEHTSELQSRFDLVCRLLLEKKKQKQKTPRDPPLHQDP